MIEKWKKIKVNSNYAVSNTGKVKSLPQRRLHNVSKQYYISKEKILKPTNNNTKGYWRVGLSTNGERKTFSIHRLVATAFIPNPLDLPQVNHKDGDKNNNNASNLEWCDNSYNMRHAIKIGLRNDFIESIQGENSHLNKYSEETIKKIPDLINQGFSYAKIGETLGIPPTLISEIKSGRAWKHLNLKIPESKLYKKRYSPNLTEK